MDFMPFDTRHYPVVGVREGYGEWASSYDRTVHDEMDLRLLEALRSVPWAETGQAVDLACGTGRVGAWLRAHGVGAVDGVDMTPEMLERAMIRGAYRELRPGDLGDTGFPGASYDLATEVLACEHLESLQPLYAEAARLTTGGGRLVTVGYHPHFLLNGIITHFHRAGGDAVGIRCYVHLFSDHVRAAQGNGWRLEESIESVVDEAWVESKPGWRRHLGHPVSFAFVWAKDAIPAAHRVR